MDSFMDKVADVGREVANAVVDTTNDVVAKGKRQMEMARIKSDIREAFRDLGEISYRVEKGDGDETRKAELVEKVDALQIRLDALESERLAEKEQKETERAERAAQRAASSQAYGTPGAREVCAACGEERIGTLAYCGHCGTKFED